MDILKTIKRVKDDFGSFVCLLWDKENLVFIPRLKTKTEILYALEFVLNPIIQVRMSYGFMRVIEKYSKLLKIERDEYQDDENWERLYSIDILRVARNQYSKEKEKVITVMTVWVRKADSQEEFRKLKPDELRGECACMSNRKLFKAKEK